MGDRKEESEEARRTCNLTGPTAFAFGQSKAMGESISDSEASRFLEMPERSYCGSLEPITSEGERFESISEVAGGSAGFGWRAWLVGWRFRFSFFLPS